MSKINLFCLPFAGGSKTAYYQYARISPEYLGIIPVELPGRGARFRETPLTDLHLMVDDILAQIRRQLSQPYAIYGHSMGAILGYLLAKKIAAEKLPPPLHLFLTGSGGPSMLRKERKLHEMAQEDLTVALKEMGGMPEEILNDEKHLNLFLPILRADLRATETFEYVANNKLDVPISVVIGSDEGITPERAEAWRKETHADVEIRKFPGNHFFIFSYSSEVIELIIRALFPQTEIQN